VEGVGVFRVLVAGSQVGDGDRRSFAAAIPELCRPFKDELAALPAGQPALVVEVRVQVQERQGGSQDFEQRPVGGADDPRPQLLEYLSGVSLSQKPPESDNSSRFGSKRIAFESR